MLTMILNDGVVYENMRLRNKYILNEKHMLIIFTISV